ncbi:MAG: hypothetical protein E7546_04600 [Ruminococcaceae bacterium]|nr:hypothetical protein [Oscillospiraceae bacterium]
MLCKECKREIDGELAFCPHCGWKIENEVIETDCEVVLEEALEQENEDVISESEKKPFIDRILIPADKPSEEAGFMDKALYFLKRYAIVYGSVIALAVVVFLAVFLLTSDSRNYKKAMELYDNGQYVEASEMFAELDDYEDSVKMAKECTYNRGCELISASDFAGASAMFEKISGYRDSDEKFDFCRIEQMYLQYPNVFALLQDKVWYFNYSGESPYSVRSITFTKERAIIKEVIIGGNGREFKHDKKHRFEITDTKIKVRIDDENVLYIPYEINGDTITIGKGGHGYYTPEQIDAAIQGYWRANDSDAALSLQLFGKVLDGADCVHFNKGSYTLEYASEGYDLPAGRYYYFGPYSGKYTISHGCIEMSNKSHGTDEWFFTVVEGEIALYHYTDRAYKTTGLPGRNGYNF